jgi:phage terminase large subunit
MTKTKRAKWILNKKQSKAWHYLNDDITTEVLLGGGAGGGKSHFGCGFVATMAMRYKNVRGFIAREELKTLKESTLLTMFDVLRQWGCKEGIDYRYYTDSHILFLKTGSMVYLKELKFYPSDPDFDYLGSTEYTFGFIDEASQVTAKAKNIIRSRIRYRLEENGLIPKLLLTCNPHKGYLYAEFYKPHKEGKLRPDRKFVQALVGDNPNIDKSYIENLKGLDLVSKERLLFGNWEYDNDPLKLIAYDSIIDMFSNVLPVDPKKNPEKYISADIARLGGDLTVLAYWEGWTVKKIAVYSKIDTAQSAKVIRKWKEDLGVPASHIIIDEDGIGGGTKDSLREMNIHVKGFVANTKAARKENYANLKSQCYYYLAQKVNKQEIAVQTNNEKIRQMITEELEQVRAKDVDKDKPLQIESKDETKKRLGRSPDVSDTLMMRVAFEFVVVPSIVWI